MSDLNHLSDERIVEYLDGTLSSAVERSANGHFEVCADCRRRLADLSQFDAFVQSHQPVDEVTTAAMFEVSQKVLMGRSAPTQGRGVFSMLLAAALLLVVVGGWWAMSGDAAGFGLRITRYVPEGVLRSAPPERFHLDLDLAEPGHVAAFARFADGRVDVLLPRAGGATELNPRGAVRLPVSEMLDWEYPADQLPREVLVVVGPKPIDAAGLQEVRAALALVAAGAVPPVATANERRAQLLAFPQQR